MSPIQMELNDSNFEFYYISYSGPGDMTGADIIPQARVHYNQRNPDGLNIASATEYLFGIHKVIMIVVFWQRVSFRRYEEWRKFITKLNSGNPSNKTSHLSLVKYEPEPPRPAS